MHCSMFSRQRLIAGLGLVCVFGLSHATQAGVTDDLELYYDFDADSTSAGGINDRSGNSRNGSGVDDDGGGINYSFSTDVAIAGLGNSFNLGGTTDYALSDTPGYNGITGVSARTVAAWVKMNSDGQSPTFVEWGSNATNGARWAFRMNTNAGNGTVGGLRVEVAGDFIISDDAINDGNWHHIAATYVGDGTPVVEDVQLYVDGVLQTTVTSGAGTPAINTSGANQVTFGSSQLITSDNRSIPGLMDEVGIWSRVLSAAEVSDLASGLTPNALAFTNFNSTTKSGTSQTMSNIVWETSSGVTANTSVTTTASNDDGYFTTGFGATGFAPDQNIENEGPWAATFELTLDAGQTGTLESIAFDYAALTNDGNSQGDNFRAQNFDITVNGNVFEGQLLTTDVNGELVFEDTAVLNAGSNLIVITSSADDTTGYNMGIDNLVFYGDVVPEPSSLALLGLSSLLIARRRRG